MSNGVGVPSTEPGGTADRILDVAERLVQTRGFHAFSYADVSAAVGIRKAGVHYHFPGKDDLGRAVAARYRAQFAGALQRIDATARDPMAKLRAYVGLYEAALANGARACLCGMLAADVLTLPGPMRAEVAGFFADQEAWLARVLADGRTSGALTFRGSPAGEAEALLSGLEGAMLVARARATVGTAADAPDGSEAARHFAAVAQQLLGALEPT